jgi:glutamate/tyrosine decarboxylase-like PLP-dependent enzyme
MGIHAGEIPRSVIYTSTQAHHSLDKAIRIAGLRECVVRNVPLNERYQMSVAELGKMIAADKRSGLLPWLVIASAGSTDVGAIDPLAAIGEIARSNGLWFHCDAAYGGFFALCAEGKKMLAGMETSHSIVMDPHKGLFLPYGTGAVLVQVSAKLLDAHYYAANYMQDANAAREELSPADLSPELTKHFRGLRFWLALKLGGVAAFRAALEEKLLLARYFYERLGGIDGFELGPYPELSVVTYRYVPKRGDAEAFNRRLVEEVRRDGRVFLSSTMLGGKFTLRLAVLAFRTHRETIDLAIDILREKIKHLEQTT